MAAKKEQRAKETNPGQGGRTIRASARLNELRSPARRQELAQQRSLQSDRIDERMDSRMQLGIRMGAKKELKRVAAKKEQRAKETNPGQWLGSPRRLPTSVAATKERGAEETHLGQLLGSPRRLPKSVAAKKEQRAKETNLGQWLGSPRRLPTSVAAKKELRVKETSPTIIPAPVGSASAAARVGASAAPAPAPAAAQAERQTEATERWRPLTPSTWRPLTPKTMTRVKSQGTHTVAHARTRTQGLLLQKHAPSFSVDPELLLSSHSTKFNPGLDRWRHARRYAGQAEAGRGVLELLGGVGESQERIEGESFVSGASLRHSWRE